MPIPVKNAMTATELQVTVALPPASSKKAGFVLFLKIAAVNALKLAAMASLKTMHLKFAMTAT